MVSSWSPRRDPITWADELAQVHLDERGADVGLPHAMVVVFTLPHTGFDPHVISWPDASVNSMCGNSSKRIVYQ
jgi:hypothetical protein